MANTTDPTHSDDDQRPPSQHDSGQAVAARWPDFYALLRVTPDSDAELLRTRIREAYMEATANSDHRNIARRIHFQTMVERIVPQARRILLDPTLRAEYDRQLALHKSGDASAKSYGTFLQEVPGSGAFGSNPTASVAVPGRQGAGDGTESDLDIATSQAAAFGAADTSEEHTFWSDLAVSDETISEDKKNAESESVISEFAASALHPPAPAAPAPAPVTPAPAPNPSAPPASSPTPAAAPKAGIPTPAEAMPAAVPIEAPPVVEAAPPPPIVVSTPAPEPTPTPAAAPEPPAGTVAAPTVPATAVGSAVGTAIPAQEPRAKDEVPEGEVRAKTVSAAEAAALANTDVVLTPEDMRISRGKEKKSFRVRPSRGGGSSGGFMSRTVQMLVTAIVAAGLTLFILRNNLGPAKVPVQVVYAPGLEKVMQEEQALFAASPAGTGTQLLMTPMDGRAAMTAAWGKSFSADMWIPSETLWSDRYSAMASEKGVLPLQQSRSLALSPSVLVVRSDRAAALRKRFPNHIISSWSGLRGAIMSDAAGHFGLGDPVKSGSGAVARYFMAKEWCAQHGKELSPDTARDAQLWRWLGGFEDNVPVSARVSSDMVKDLALGTGDRYWWAIALESDAISWIQDGKDLEIWYLPQTNYADHPLASWDRERGAAGGAAMAAFESLLRSDKSQTIFLKHGLRPTGIELTAGVNGNPFTDKKMRARGLKSSGFRVVERIPYKTLNALAAQWAEKYSG